MESGCECTGDRRVSCEQTLSAGCSNSREDGNTESAPDLLRRIEESGRQPGIIGRDPGVRRCSCADEDSPEAERHYDQTWEQIARVRAMDRHAREVIDACGRNQGTDY
jgi:hypothetical protein